MRAGEILDAFKGVHSQRTSQLPPRPERRDKVKTPAPLKNQLGLLMSAQGLAVYLEDGGSIS